MEFLFNCLPNIYLILFKLALKLKWQNKWITEFAIRKIFIICSDIYLIGNFLVYFFFWRTKREKQQGLNEFFDTCLRSLLSKPISTKTTYMWIKSEIKTYFNLVSFYLDIEVQKKIISLSEWLVDAVRGS